MVRAVPASAVDLSELRSVESKVRGVIETTTPATVAITVGWNNGSGVIVRDDGLVLTAGHVLGKPDLDATVILADGRRLEARTLGVNHDTDTGMVKILDPGPFPAVEFGDSRTLSAGDWCVSAGHPGGYDANRGQVFRLGRFLGRIASFLRTDCPIIQGDSGGPLFDLDGRLIGIHSRLQWQLSSNYHVPIHSYEEQWSRLLAGELWSTPMLGIEGRSEETGCRVLRVLPGMPAERAGLRRDDVIVAFQGNAVSGMQSLTEHIKACRAGDRVTLQVLREGQLLEIETRLAERPR